MTTPNAISRKNRAALALLLVALIMVGVLLSLPAYTFTSSVYTKKSSNTFVGDEKYEEALAEVNAVADEYRANGFGVEIREDVTERTNSKGETTSLVTFTINESFTRNGWSFLNAGLASTWTLLALVLCLVLCAACAGVGLMQSMGEPYRELDGRSASFRAAAGWLALLALILIPVFMMMNTYALSRRVALYSGDIVTEGRDAFYALLDRFLFDGIAGSNIDSALKGLSFQSTWAIWMTMPCVAVMLLACIQLRHGSLTHTLVRGLLYAFVIALSLFILYPYYVMLVTGFRSSAETNDMYFLHIFPTEWKFGNLKDILSRGVLKYLLNSLMIAGGATVIALLCGIPAAYAMARMRFRGKGVFLGFVIISQMFSPVVLLIGIAQLMSALHLNDSIVGLMLVNAAFNQAFAIWLLRGTFVSISPEMEQAAKIDGCNTMGSLIRVLIPMAAPGIVTTLIFVFINSWNEYTISTVLISTATNRPITVGITQFSSFNMIEWQNLFAASLLATIPVVILFMCIEKHLTSGLTSGGVKG